MSDARAQNDRPAEVERGPDCLVELATIELQRRFRDLSDAARGAAINDLCLVISQMRHLDPTLMDRERSRWVERIAARLCAQIPAMQGYQGAVQLELEKRVTAAMLDYHDWREKHALPLNERNERSAS